MKLVPEDSPGLSKLKEAHGISAEDLFNEIVLDSLPVGVVVLDRQGFVIKYNRFEEQLARRSRRDVIGRHFFNDVAVCTDVPEVSGRFNEHIESNTLAAELDFAFALPFLPEPRDVRLFLRSFDIEGHRFGLLVVEDLTLPKELERQRQRLLDIMVHDLRNPLQGILGYSSLLTSASEKNLPPEKMQEALRTIEDSARRMDRLLAGTLAELRGERRTWRPVNMHALTLSALGNLLPVAGEHEVTLVYGGKPFFQPLFPDRAIVVHGVVDQLASLVQNLLANAVKYAKQEIQVDLTEQSDSARLVVRDDGPGICQSELSHIFEEGYQTPDSLPGSGLGLFSVRRAVELHDGTISVTSDPGEGCVFTVELPKPSASRSASPPSSE